MRWIERQVAFTKDCGIEEMQSAKCSACGRYLTTPYHYSFYDYPYCPMCGEKREGNDASDR